MSDEGSGVAEETGEKVIPSNPLSLYPKTSADAFSSLRLPTQSNVPTVPTELEVLFRQRTSDGWAKPVEEKNSSEVMVPLVTVKRFVTCSAQLVAMLPPTSDPNPAGMDVKTSELAAPEPEPPGFTNGRSNVPVMVPRVGPDVRLTVNVYILPALAKGTNISPTNNTTAT
jgi:hypothetical protein